MATLEDAIYNILANDAAVAAVVGTRIYRVRMPDNPTFPAITYQTTYGTQVESFTGYSGLKMPVVAIDCWGKTAKVTQELAEKVRTALHGYSGTYSDIRIDNVLEWSFVEMYESDTETFHISCSARFWYY
jgi:hypothetical protein